MRSSGWPFLRSGKQTVKRQQEGVVGSLNWCCVFICACSVRHQVAYCKFLLKGATRAHTLYMSEGRGGDWLLTVMFRSLPLCLMTVSVWWQRRKEDMDLPFGRYHFYMCISESLQYSSLLCFLENDHSMKLWALWAWKGQVAVADTLASGYLLFLSSFVKRNSSLFQVSEFWRR